MGREVREHHSTDKVLDVMNVMGVSLEDFSICVGYWKVMDTLVRLMRWGDDFLLEETEVALQGIPR